MFTKKSCPRQSFLSFHYWKRQVSEKIANFHKDIFIQIIVAFLCIIGATYAFYTSDNTNKKDVKPLFEMYSSVGVVLGLIYTAYNIHSRYHYQKRDRASHYVELWYSPLLQKSLTVIRNLKKSQYDYVVKQSLEKDKCLYCQQDKSFLKENLQIKCLYSAYDLKRMNPELMKQIQQEVCNELLLDSSSEKRQDIYRLLEFFEQMGADIKLDVADERYLKEFFYSVVINYYEILKEFIKQRNIKYNSSLIYCNFIYMAELWENYRVKPKPHSICYSFEKNQN